MKKFLFAGILLLLTACGGPTPEQEFLINVSEKVILPSYQSLADKADVFAKELSSCTVRPMEEKASMIDSAKPQWRQLMSAWERVQWVQFGPIKDDGREWSLQFWPDRKNLVGRKVRDLMASQGAILPERMEWEGVLVKGLSAMEAVLYDEELIAFGEARQCEALSAISGEISQVATSLLNDWKLYHEKNFDRLIKQGDIQDITDLESSGYGFVTANQGVSLIINQLINSLGVIVDQKIATPFAIDRPIEKANGYFLESWKSQTSRDNIYQNLLTLEEIIYTGGLKSYLQSVDRGVLADALVHHLQNSLRLTQELQQEQSYFSLLQSNKENARELIGPLYKELSMLRDLMTDEVVEALGVQFGFNASDGDS